MQQEQLQQTSETKPYDIFRVVFHPQAGEMEIMANPSCSIQDLRRIRQDLDMMISDYNDGLLMSISEKIDVCLETQKALLTVISQLVSK